MSPNGAGRGAAGEPSIIGVAVVRKGRRSAPVITDKARGYEEVERYRRRSVWAGGANQVRLRSALGFVRPVDYYRENPAQLHEARRRKLSAARHRRIEKNLRLRQPTLP